MNSFAEVKSMVFQSDDEDTTPSILSSQSDMLENMREVSDALWQATATLGVTLSTLETLDAYFKDLKDKTCRLKEGSIDGDFAEAYLMQLALILRQATFQGTNLLTQEGDMEVLTNTSMENGAKSRVFHTVPSAHLGLDAGPFRVTLDQSRNKARIMVLTSFNAPAAIAGLDTLALCLRHQDGRLQTIVNHIKWTRNPTYICAAVQAAIGFGCPEIGQVPVVFDGSGISIGPTETITIEAISLMGSYVGALSPIKKLLEAASTDGGALAAAVELAILSVHETQTLYEEKLQEIGRMETMTLALMERIALHTIMPRGAKQESAALTATQTAQMLSAGKYTIAPSCAETLRLMLREESSH